MPQDRHLESQLRVHQSVFDELLDRAETATNAGRLESAASLLAMAADVAARNHTGSYVDDRMERLLIRLAEQVTVVETPLPGEDATPGHAAPAEYAVDDLMPDWSVDDDVDVMHVVGEMTTRAVEETVARWTTFAPGRSGVVSTHADGQSILERAALLRARLDRAALVVVHTDPDDIVVVLALGAGDRAPVIWLNHHDLSFWPGVSVADLVVSHQATGSALAVDRRCVPVGRTMLLPPFAADGDIWTRVLGVIDERAREVTRALLLPRVLPREFDGNDLERVRLLRSAGRSDGLLGAYRRHGEFLDAKDRPDMTAIVLAQDSDRTIECLHRVLDTWTMSSQIQLLVIDHEGSTDIGDMIDDLTGTIRGVRSSTPGDLMSAITEGMRWAWGPYAAVLPDDSTPMVGAWEAAIGQLEFDTIDAVAPMMSLRGDRPDGLVVRTDAADLSIEHAFGLIREGAIEEVSRWLTPRQRWLSPVSTEFEDH